jgi:hypothetical protein
MAVNDDSQFGLAQLKQEGTSIPYDCAPAGPPETWRDRIKWRMKRLRNRLRHIACAITGRDTGY